MYKVLIVDDEISVCKGLPRLIDWGSYGFEVVGAVYSGEEALKFLQSDKIDLMITDLRMEGISGIELIKQAKQIYPQLKFVIISSWKDFEDSRKALSLGVTGYLLKPVEEDELIELLKDIAETMRLQTELSAESKQKRILQMIKGDASATDEVLQWFNGARELVYLQFITNSDCFSEFDEISPANVAEVIFGRESERFSICVFSETDTRIGVIFPVGATQSLLTVDEIAQSAWEHFAQKNQDVSVIVGSGFRSAEQLKKCLSYIELCRKHRFYEGTDRVYRHVEFLEDKNVEKLDVSIFGRHIGDLLAAVEKNDLMKLRQCVEKFEIIARESFGSIAATLLYYNNIALEVVKQYNSENAEIYFSEYLELVKNEDITLPMLSKFLYNYTLQICSVLKKRGAESSLGIIAQVIAYVQEHYAEKLNMQIVANHFFLNKAYLGQLFKKRMGISFNYYLNMIRIEQSKQLLTYTDLNVYEIAGRVGFKDSNYFCVKFEAFTGMSASAYRETYWNKKP